jgi:hypothetical protein
MLKFLRCYQWHDYYLEVVILLLCLDPRYNYFFLLMGKALQILLLALSNFFSCWWSWLAWCWIVLFQFWFSFPLLFWHFLFFPVWCWTWGLLGCVVLTGAFSTRSADCRFFCRKPETATGGMYVCMLWTIWWISEFFAPEVLQVNAFHTLRRFYGTSNTPNCFQQIQTIRSWLWSTKHSVSVLCMICGILSKLGSSYFLDVLCLTRWEW